VAVRGGGDAGNPVLGAVVEAPRRAQTLAEGDLVVRAGGGEDGARAGGEGQLDPGYGDGRGAGVEEDAVAGAEAADLVQGLGGCYPRLGDAGCFRPG